MCRTRQEIIESSPHLLNLQLSIDKYEKELKSDNNGKTALALDHARTSLQVAIDQIQFMEDSFSKLKEAEKKRQEIKVTLSKKIDSNSRDIREVKNNLAAHIKHGESNLTIKEMFVNKPLNFILKLSAFFLPAITAIFLILMAILYATGWEYVIKGFLDKLLGL